MSGQVVTNITVHEVCVLRPDISSLNLSGCEMVDDAGLWAIARHCTGLRELWLSGKYAYCRSIIPKEWRM